jgi:hypothetical protein
LGGLEGLGGEMVIKKGKYRDQELSIQYLQNSLIIKNQ